MSIIVPSLRVILSKVRGAFNSRPIIGTGQWSLKDSLRQRVRYGRDEKSELEEENQLYIKKMLETYLLFHITRFGRRQTHDMKIRNKSLY